MFIFLWHIHLTVITESLVMIDVISIASDKKGQQG